jgi:hypothetical protein
MRFSFDPSNETSLSSTYYVSVAHIRILFPTTTAAAVLAEESAIGVVRQLGSFDCDSSREKSEKG